MYPGRFLTEIEEHEDWGRLMRVVEAQRIEYIESIALQQKQGLISNDKISAKQWEAIRANQRLIEEWMENGEG